MSVPPASSIAPVSKLPNVGTTIFSVMSALAAQHGAINLSQGFPNFPADPDLIGCVSQAMLEGHNQYAPMPGHPALRQQIAAQALRNYAVGLDPETEITITSGGCEALFCAIQSVTHPGDEVIVLEPCYDSYVPAIQLAGGVPVPVQLTFPSYSVDWQAVRAAVTPRTRALILNTPHNPTGAVWSATDLVELEQLVSEHGIYIISDEVYEHLVLDGITHQGMLRSPALYTHSFIVGSFGKSLHVTGWKLGYCLAPPAFTHEFRKIHQYVTFCCPTPFQVGIARYMESQPDFGTRLGSFFQAKRDAFFAALAPSRFHLLPCRGTYFALADYRDIQPDMPDQEFARWLTLTHGVATIPVSAFYADGTDNRLVRFCFAKTEDTLEEAAQRLCRV